MDVHSCLAGDMYDFQADLPLLLATHTPHWVPMLHRLELLFGKACEITKQVVLWQGTFINNCCRTFGTIGEILANYNCRIKTCKDRRQSLRIVYLNILS